MEKKSLSILIIGTILIIGSILVFKQDLFNFNPSSKNNSNITTTATTTNNNSSTFTTSTISNWDCLSNTPLNIVTANYIELSKISNISRFRSGIGHDFSDQSESCRSMKHYFVPYSHVDWTSVRIFSPITGKIILIEPEWAGVKIQIRSDLYENLVFVIFHMEILSNITLNMNVIAGDHIGFHTGNETYSDIAVECRLSSGLRYLSYFDIMTDNVFTEYTIRGISDRSQFIISKEERDMNPLVCNSDQSFKSPGTIENWVYLN